MTRLFSKEPKLSILIPHLKERGEKLSRLLFQLQRQINDYPVEVLIHDGDGTTGQKRNELIAEAKGEWVVHIDDDDTISDDYIKEICKNLHPYVNGIGFIVEVHINKKIYPAYHIPLISRYGQYPSCFVRPLNHLNVIRKSLCVPFKEITRGEDVRFANEMQPILKDKKCIFIPKVLYYYDASHNH